MIEWFCERQVSVLARRKKYTPEAFARAVDKYFRSISYDQTARLLSGDVIESRDRKKSINEVLFAVPPTLSGLCLTLCISRDTFAAYAKDEAYADTCAYAREVVEAYLENQLLTRTKGIEGVKFSLQNNFGWSDKHEVDTDSAEITVTMRGMEDEYAE